MVSRAMSVAGTEASDIDAPLESRAMLLTVPVVTCARRETAGNGAHKMAPRKDGKRTAVISKDTLIDFLTGEAVNDKV
jgi:hypothetical protein